MAKVHSSLATTELHNPKGMGVESATEELLTMSASIGAVSASASMVPHTTDTYDLGSAGQRWNNITAAGNISSSLISTGSFGRLELAGNATVDGTLTIAGGTTTIGDAASDTLVITADLASNLIPDADGTRDIGSAAASWKDTFFDGTGSFGKVLVTDKLFLHDSGGEYIDGDGTDLNFYSSADINIPASVGLTFGNDGEKIEGDGTDLTITGNIINLSPTADVAIPANKGITFATAEKIESDGTDLTITVGAGGDINVGSDIGVTYGADTEKIEGDGTDLTIASSAKINLTATSDIHIPNDVGIVFGGDSEKIEGDGTDLVISANNLTVDAAADITLDSGGNDLNFAAGGTTVLTITNSSSDVIVKPIVDAKDLIFQQRDGTEVMRIEDGAYMSLAAMAVNPEVALSDGANIAWNVLTSPVAKVTLAGNRNLSAASGGVAGQFVSLLVIQDGTGSRTLTPNAVYEFTGDVAPTLTTAANKGDLFVFRYNGSKYLEVGRNLNLTLS